MSNLIPHQQPSSFFHAQERDILAELLADKRSENTRRAYDKDLKDFFLSVSGHEPNPQLIIEFLKLERFTAIALVLQYKAKLIEKGLAEATVNRRLAAIKSLVKYAQKIGKCEWSLEEVQGEKAKAYRDTSGVDRDSYRAILEGCDRSTLQGQRNYAILRLLWDNALRRGEVVKLNVSDFDAEARSLTILGKGRGTQKERVSLSAATVEAIEAWLQHFPNWGKDSPLFIALDNVHHGHRLTGNAIYNLVFEAAQKAGIKKRFSPHRCRHSSITAALDATGGNVREVQKLSRHKNLQTVLLYDDARLNAQQKVTDLLSEMM
ncbi:tyrosine-type recombinase/integrase [Trichocoleus desertorum AS-A10]|uniref:tyrosine-type recombinase/integrase n=1 Tax=Trichocoleus desertorum TaxID=1481672 RepID=UPI003297D15E